MISVDEARSKIFKEISVVDTEVVSLDKAHGRVLTEDVNARRTQPPSNMSAMDGFAVKAADTQTIPAQLEIIGKAPAGGSYEGIVQPGETVRIFTGGPLPEGTDSIVIQEDTNLGEDSQQEGYIEIREVTPVGHYVRPAGLDFKAGTIGLKANRRLSARDIGLLAAMNVPWVTVRRKPRIALLSTGDELVRPGEPVGPNQIISSNSLLVAALIQQTGGEAIDLGIAKDNEDSLRQMAAGAQSADMLVTLGGASVGDHDLVQTVLGKEGLSVDFWRIAMRPGKPLMSGDLNGTPMLGMPGNPVSSMICSFLFLIPAIDVLLGLPPRRPPLSQAVIAHPVKENDQREDYLRARIIDENDGVPVVELFQKQDSSLLSRLADADCLLLRAPFASALPAQSPVEIIYLRADYPDV